jgi:hypothetical protein
MYYRCRSLSFCFVGRWNALPHFWSSCPVELSSTSPWRWTLPAPTATPPHPPPSTTGKVNFTLGFYRLLTLLSALQVRSTSPLDLPAPHPPPCTTGKVNFTLGFYWLLTLLLSLQLRSTSPLNFTGSSPSSLHYR